MRTSLPVPDGQGDGAAHHLVGLAGIDAEAHRQLDGLVELGRGQALHQVDGLGGGVQLLAVEPLGCVGVLLAVLRHVGSLGSGTRRRCDGDGARTRSFRCARGPDDRRTVDGQTTLMPIERAVPATCSLAASRSLALRSGILIWAISVDLGRR